MCSRPAHARASTQASEPIRTMSAACRRIRNIARAQARRRAAVAVETGGCYGSRPAKATAASGRSDRVSIRASARPRRVLMTFKARASARPQAERITFLCPCTAPQERRVIRFACRSFVASEANNVSVCGGRVVYGVFNPSRIPCAGPPRDALLSRCFLVTSLHQQRSDPLGQRPSGSSALTSKEVTRCPQDSGSFALASKEVTRSACGRAEALALQDKLRKHNGRAEALLWW